MALQLLEGLERLDPSVNFLKAAIGSPYIVKKKGLYVFTWL